MAGRLPALVASAAVGAAALLATGLVPAKVDRTNCTRVVVSSSTEKGDLVKQLADRYNRADRAVGGRCVQVDAYQLTSGRGLTQIKDGWRSPVDGQPRPHVWLPSTSLWVDLLEHQAVSPMVVWGRDKSIARSPLVFAMPRVMAEHLSGQVGEIRWEHLQRLANEGWGAFGKPEWGPFAMGKDSARLSSSGLAATISTYAAGIAKDGRSDYDDEALLDPDVISFVKNIESSVAYYDDDSVVFLGHLYREDRKGRDVPYISGMIMQEQMAFLYNSGAPTGKVADVGHNPEPNDPLVAVQPGEGTVMLDHPFAVLSNADSTVRAAARDFHDFLLEREQQEAFVATGFRRQDGKPQQGIADKVGDRDLKEVKLIKTPPAAAVEKILDGWDVARRRARVLLVLDVSGSMKELADPGSIHSATRLDVVKAAVERGLGLLDNDDEVGLWTFSSAADPAVPPYTEVVPISPVGAVKERLKTAVAALEPNGDTALYDTVRAARQEVLADLDRSKINAVVLLSDGADTSSRQVGKEQLLAESDATQLETSVRIFTIPFGHDADVATLAEIAAVSKAGSYDASNPVDIDQVFTRVFNHFFRNER
ncbi:substrate-binding domain-containing protein [Saccharothrix syringae]|uniref:VWA domain-containing protein n=1 Tax=Saccharothrix syringae TaxID=103733 RepID=A0A5Q0H4Z8_SACSY|nr:substrate-binding domain-containing protein [Saccharothrix syringae]QFZ21277.1 VWA domain-containing protein [Saccharothrix syringae]